MKKILSSVLISFILFTNLIIPISVFAATPDILNVVSYTGPQDESVTFTDPMEFSVIFDAPEIPKEVDQPNKNYNVFFQATCVYIDGTTKDMPKGGGESGAHYIISNQSKFIAGQKMSLEARWTWRFSAANMASGCPTSPSAPSGVIWTLRENNTDSSFTKEYLKKTFKFKAMRSFKLPGYYYVTTDTSGDYKVSNVLGTQPLCDNDSTSFIKNNPSYKLFKPCEYYDDLPIFHKQNLAVSFDPKIGVAQNKTVYQMLAPLPGISCMDWSGNNTAGCIGNNVGDYLNIIFKLGIGIAAALAVIMLIINGITYMGDESIFAKTEAKSKMFSAVLGLLIALGAWALLNTISPALTGKGGVNIGTASIEITDFGISGGATFDGKPISVNFNKVAYPAAKIASEKTGVETAFILAMFAQETGNGANTGGCNYTNAKMGDGQLQALKTIATNLGRDYTVINMSCSGAVANDHGGAIGYTQFIPTTWLQYSGKAKQLLGHEPNPWDASDALMMTAIFLQDKGGAGSNTANQEAAACKYFGSCAQTVSCGGGVNGTYGQCILGKKVSIQQQIDASIKKGEI